MSDPNVNINDRRVRIRRERQPKQPKAYGEESLEDIVADLQQRVARLESQAGTS